MSGIKRNLPSAIFIIAYILSFSSIFIDPVPSKEIEQISTFAEGIGIKSPFPIDGAYSYLFVLFHLAPLLWAIGYFFGIRFSGALFLLSFSGYLIFPLIFGLGGAEVYTAIDIAFEDILNAAGGVLALYILQNDFGSTADQRIISRAGA